MMQEQDLWTHKIWPQIKNIIKMSLISVMDSVEHRKNSFEIYGYDFMIDEDLKTWLIEVNSSPAMDYSTPVTTPLVKAVLEDTVKVVVDEKQRVSPALKRDSSEYGIYNSLSSSPTLPEVSPTSGKPKPGAAPGKKMPRMAQVGEWELLYQGVKQIGKAPRHAGRMEVQGKRIVKKIPMKFVDLAAGAIGAAQMAHKVKVKRK